MKPKNFYRSVLSAGLALCTTGSFSQSAPTASFSVSDTIGCSPLNIQFNNESANADSYYWDFGNGNTSILEDPSNMYIDPGTNTVTLIATSAGGQQDTIVLNDVIAVVPDVIAGNLYYRIISRVRIRMHGILLRRSVPITKIPYPIIGINRCIHKRY